VHNFVTNPMIHAKAPAIAASCHPKKSGCERIRLPLHFRGYIFKKIDFSIALSILSN